MTEQVTREQLEAWAHEEIAEKWAQNDREVTMIMDDLLDMLDRQAAITRRETRQRWQDAPNVLDRTNLETIAELTAKCDQLSRDLTAEHALVTQFEHDNEVLRDTANTLRLSIINLRDTAKDLTAERDELKHDNSLLRSTIAELGVKVDEKQAELLEARASCKSDSVKIQLALARFAEEWAHTDTRVQEQRCIVYHAQHIADFVDNHTEND